MQRFTYNEPLDGTELAFLGRRERREKRQYYKTYSMLMVLSFIIPFAGAWYQAFANAPNAFSPWRYFLGVGVLLFLSTGGTVVSYLVHLRKVQLDIRDKTKTIEISQVTRKQYMPQNHTYYFYLTSPNRLSIEVSQEEFYHYKEGDEVSIEYTSHGKIYLGHF